MNIDNYEYNGFKLYHVKNIMGIDSTDKKRYNEYDVIIQFKNGVEYKRWSEQISYNLNNGVKTEQWCETELETAKANYNFVKNLTDEEVFAIFL